MISERIRRLARREHGNTLILMPVGVLVVFLLAAVAVDAAVLFLAQRRVADLAASVAHDAVAAVDEGTFYDDDVQLDRGGAETRRAGIISGLAEDDAFRNPRCAVDVSGVTATADCEADVRVIFSQAFPGVDRLTEVTASETSVGRGLDE